MLRYAITDRSLSPLRGQDSRADLFDQGLNAQDSKAQHLVDQARRLSSDGVDFLQVREKDLSARDLIGLTQRIITAVRNAGVAGGRAGDAGGPGLHVLVNGRPDVAIASGADGVHLPSGPEQLSVGEVKRLFGRVKRVAGQREPLLVSVACHTLEEIKRASGDGADLLLFSPVYGKRPLDGKRIAAGAKVEGTGLARLAEACRAAGDTPVLALGGITPGNAQACIDAGARGVAGIRLFL